MLNHGSALDKLVQSKRTLEGNQNSVEWHDLLAHGSPADVIYALDFLIRVVEHL